MRSAVIETGLSDFHKMTLAIIETHSEKEAPNIVEYSDFRKCLNDLFRKGIQKNLRPKDIFQNDQIHTIMYNIFSRQAPLEIKVYSS